VPVGFHVTIQGLPRRIHWTRPLGVSERLYGHEMATCTAVANHYAPSTCSASF